MTQPGNPPLAGVRIVDLSSEIAGPYATKIFVDAGADVVKVESVAGDPLRRWTTSGQDLAGRDGALFQFLNAGKKSVVWDLDAEPGRDRLLRLVADADIVVEDFGPGGLAARRIDFDTLHALNPRLCLLSISSFGLEGPWADRPATEWTLGAEVGSTAYRGLPERGPLGAGGRLGEWIAGSYGAVGALTAWRAARLSGRGQHVDLSMFEAMNLSMTTFHDLFGQFFEGPLAQAIEIPSILPARDGWVGVCTYTAQQWTDFCALLGRPDVSADDRFFDGTARMQHMEFMQSVIHEWTQRHTVDEIIELGTAMRIPVAPIGNGKTVLEMDQFRERGVFVDNPAGFKQPRTPYLVSGMPTPPLRPAPVLGADTAEIEAALTPGSESGTSPPPIESGSVPLPFDGLRVVDLTAFWAGPIVTATLGALGADVVKVESVQRPDGMRFSGTVRNDMLWEYAAVFHGANPSKRGITLDLDREEGKALLRRLLEGADVVIENFSARVMENFGFTWDVMHSIQPRLISVRMPAWGLDGPWKDRVGFAPSVEQASGLAWTTGYEDMPLILRGVCDPVGGMHGIVALICALEERERTGAGMLVELPLVEPALNIAAEQVIEYTAYGELLTRHGNRSAFASPQAVFACRPSSSEARYEKKHLAISVANDEQWQALISVLGSPDWAKNPEFAAEAGRRRHEDAIEGHLAEELSGEDCDVIAGRLLSAGVPASALVNAHFISPNPQLEARGFLQLLDRPITGVKRYPGLPFRFSSRSPGWHTCPPPTLGQHNEAVLSGELGLSESDLDELREKKIIGKRPAFEMP
jgi:crotonobetainyl-CoA:carnitine CoA-transferase CaiB-like acyl-CoA transferase